MIEDGTTQKLICKPTEMKEKDVPPELQVFQNDLLLEIVLSFLPFCKLLELRTVNWLCKSVADKLLWKRKSRVFFTKLFSLLKHKHTIDASDLAEHAANMFTTTDCDFPFHSYVFENLECVTNSDLLSDTYDLLRDRMSKTAQHMCFVTSQKQPWCWSAADSYPRLKSLAFYALDRETSSGMYYSMSHFMRIIHRSPCLDSLGFLNKHSIQEFELGIFLKCINDQVWQRIRNLELQSTFTGKDLQQLSELDLKLKHIKIVFSRTSVFSADTFKTFMTGQFDTLEELNLTGNASSLRISFPEMRKLETLKITIRPPNFQLPELSYALQFPALKKLVLNGLCEENVQGCINNRMHPAPSVEYLEMDKDFNIAEAVQIFPDIKELCITPNRNYESLIAITCLKHVVKLTLAGSNAGYFLFLLGKDCHDAVPQTKSFFEKLEVLKVVNVNYLPNGTLDFLLKHGKSLRCLDMWESPNIEITPFMLQKMRDRFSVYYRGKKTTVRSQ